jgi:hypothetical protein
MAAEAVCPARQISGEQLQNSVSISHVFPRAYEPRALLFPRLRRKEGNFLDLCRRDYAALAPAGRDDGLNAKVVP